MIIIINYSASRRRIANPVRIEEAASARSRHQMDLGFMLAFMEKYIKNILILHFFFKLQLGIEFSFYIFIPSNL